MNSYQLSPYNGAGGQVFSGRPHTLFVPDRKGALGDCVELPDDSLAWVSGGGFMQDMALEKTARQIFDWTCRNVLAPLSGPDSLLGDSL